MRPVAVQRERCYKCRRPLKLCFCEHIPSIQNQTHVLILQHMRERFHPFNTARICKQALQNSTILADHNSALSDRLDEYPLHENVGLLYPGPDGRLLSDLAPAERPSQLVVIDGTWHHAKTLVRDIPRLNNLPRFQILPTEPGRYRIRKEPDATSLSTLEAIVAAFDALEPDTQGLSELVAAFNSMVETQLAHPKAKYGWRKNKKRSRNAMGVPRAILHDLPNVVVAYGESQPGIAGQKHRLKSSVKHQPVYWVAQRLITNETFRCMIKPPTELTDTFLNYLGMPRAAWDQAVSVESFRDQWKRFLRADDQVTVYHNSTAALLDNTGAINPGRLVLKSVNFDPQHQHPTLDAYLSANGIETPNPIHRGRAGQRLANAIAMVFHLNRQHNTLDRDLRSDHDE